MTMNVFRAVSAALLLMLSACGGGGGGGASTSDSGGDSGGGSRPPDTSPTATTFKLSGTLSVVESSAVDSDLNDPTQKNVYQTYRINDTFATAQPLTTPVLLVGTVNEAKTGPVGNNSSASSSTLNDEDDYFKVDLTAGQVIELEFTAEPSKNDVDLYVYDSTGKEAGYSAGENSRYECIRVSRSGTYFVNVYAYKGASIYNLRIGAPGTGSSCGNATAALSTSALLAQPLSDRSGTLSAQALADHRALRASAGVTLEEPTGLGPRLLRLPSTLAARRNALTTLTSGLSARMRVQSASVASGDEPLTPMDTLVTTLKVIKPLRSSGAYDYVEPDWMMESHALVGAFPPNDQYYGYQRWHYEQIKLPSAINRLNALSVQPTQRPIVAVIDNGVLLSHPDLQPQLFSNGRSFVGGTSTPSGDSQFTSPSRNASFHGSHVAGTVAASTFNGVGAAGVAPMAQILPVNVFGPTANAAVSDTANAILYASGLANSSGMVPTRRADVINMSLGGDHACDAAYQDAINRARNAGVIVVASAGNHSLTTVGAPANCNGVISVSATQADRSVTSYSNTGSALKVAAPGGDGSRSTTGNGQPDSVFSTWATFTAAGTRIGNYSALDGTSMASPHVAGVMALMRYVNPALTPAQVDSLLASGALTDDLGAAGWDSRYGHGLINADKAVAAALNSVNQPVPTPAGVVTAEPSSMDFGSFQSTASFTLGRTGSTTERVTRVVSSQPNVLSVSPVSVDANGLGTYSASMNRGALAAGTTYLTLTVELAGGTRASFQMTVAVSKTTTSAGRASGYGPIYVLLIDPDDDSYVKTALASFSASTGKYSWTYAGYARSKVLIVAGSDLDNDDTICQRGEACGGYPILDAALAGSAVTLTGDRSGLDFQVTPLSGNSAQSFNEGAARAGWTRGRIQP